MPELTITTVNIGTPDPPALARFYCELLGLEVLRESPVYVLLKRPEGGVALSFQHEKHYTAPTWPGVANQPGMMMHLEIRVDDLDSAVEHALACGATLADFQPQEHVRVCLDPAGHPFCLWTVSA